MTERRWNVGTAVGFAGAIVALVLASAQAGYAQDPVDWKKQTPKIGAVIVLDQQKDGEQQPAYGDCDTLTPCQIFDPVTEGHQPAVSFVVDEETLVHIEADVFEDENCELKLGTAAGDLVLPAGLVRVFLRFDPPLPKGTSLSLKWRVDHCPELKCFKYVIGDKGQLCPKG